MITWSNDKRRLRDLTAWDKNPRRIKPDQAKKLVESLEEFGQVETIAIEPDNTIIDGHQREKVWRAASKFGDDYEVDVRIASRKLTEQERKKLIVFLHKGAAGEFDFEAMANLYDVAELTDWGFSEKELQLGGFDVELEGEYSKKIEAPIYTPKGEKPAISELFDQSKTLERIAEIDASDIPDEEKQFLRVAAQRHTVFNYRNMAEYYSQSDEKVQALMENSALVIIDFKKAIELGYVRLTEEIAKTYGEEYGNA